MKVLGVDPGSRVTGYGLVEVARPPRLLRWGVIRLGTRIPLPQRLRQLYDRLKGLLKELRPEVMVLEEVIPERFPRSALALGQAQGIVLLLSAEAELPLFTYHPSTIKLALTGNGRASKEQVAYMVRATLGLNGDTPPDATDALAVALTHIFREQACFPRSEGV